jgi:hypothetical protein
LLFLECDTDISYAWQDFPFHVMTDTDMQGIAFLEFQGSKWEIELVMSDAGSFGISVIVNETAF